MRNLILVFVLVMGFLFCSSVAGSPNPTGKKVRYKGVFYTMVEEGRNYCILVNSNTGATKRVVYSK